LKNQSQQDCIWLLLGPRSGDNAQIRSIAAHLEMPGVEKHLTYNPLHMVPNVLKGASLLSLRPAARTQIRPPWPRMVIGVGKRSVAIARYIREKSGGSTRLVQLGRPRANRDHFDLVVTTPQYGLLPGANVLELPVPPSGLSRPDDEDLEAIQAQFTAGKPRPYVILVAGGSNTTATFTVQAAQNLARLAQQRTNDLGGSLFAVASPRTPARVIEALHRDLGTSATFIPWKPSEKRQSNPYAAFLSLGDEIIVTSDSASMIADALSVNKPVKIYQLPVGWQGRFSAGVIAVFNRVDRIAAGSGVMILFLAPWRGLRACGLINPPRQMELLIRPLFEYDLAQAFPAPTEKNVSVAKTPEKPEFSANAIRRIASLLEE